jgi:glycosyltransferase involved in cell wall biosynthesis
MLKKIYRICDHRNGGTKIPHVTKRQCFLNFIEVFGVDNLVVVADNTSQGTIEFISRYVSTIERTSLGNSGSFLYAAQLALQYHDDDLVYLVEDDYLHLPKSRQCLLEGLQHADYVSLYDHADKYMLHSPNPLVKDGGENTKVILTASSHWKYTNSTTMTFATKVGTFKADQSLFKDHCKDAIPKDYYLFRALAQRGRTLLTPIPGRSTHCDEYPSPFIFNSAFPFKKDQEQPKHIVNSTPRGIQSQPAGCLRN